MLYFSKSKYTEFKQCPKASWLHKHRPELYKLDDEVKSRMNMGNDVGDLAMGLFGDYFEVTRKKPDGSLDLEKMKALTRQYISEGREIICEASFSYNGAYCAVDILRKTEQGYLMYEVKASTKPDKPVYLLDACYQKYVLEKCGIHVAGVNIVTLNNKYVFDGTLDIKKLFNITDVTARVGSLKGTVEGDLKYAEEIHGLKEEPDIDISCSCATPYDCAFWDYCSRNLPKPSVFDLYDIDFSNAVELYKKGVKSFEDVKKCGKELNKIEELQIAHALEDNGTYANAEGIKEFLNSLTPTLYFLDFESVQPAVPQYIGTRSFQQIPVQYSLHILNTATGELKHKEFLGRSEGDSREELAKRLVEDIPADANIIVYNKTFESSCIRDLANAFPHLSEHLNKIKDNIVDLIVPFRAGYYYNRNMGGSFSIKSVLPAIFPDNPELDYKNLQGVHNGGEAKSLFPRLKYMEQAERTVAEQNLLKYCELDTYAMVKVYEELVRVANGEKI